jgi:hypothetical protein
MPFPATTAIVLGQLKAGIVAISVSGSCGATVTWILTDTYKAAGFIVGSLIALFFFSLSSLVTAWADLVNRNNLLKVGIATYIGKIVLVGFVVFAAANSQWSGLDGLLWGIVITTVAWLTSQTLWAIHQATTLRS